MKKKNIILSLLAATALLTAACSDKKVEEKPQIIKESKEEKANREAQEKEDLASKNRNLPNSWETATHKEKPYENGNEFTFIETKTLSKVKTVTGEELTASEGNTYVVIVAEEENNNEKEANDEELFMSQPKIVNEEGYVFNLLESKLIFENENENKEKLALKEKVKRYYVAEIPDTYIYKDEEKKQVAEFGLFIEDEADFTKKWYIKKEK